MMLKPKNSSQIRNFGARKPNNKQSFLGNKKGGEKYLSIWWFFVLAFIAGGIVIAVSAFNVVDINSNKIEADILVSRVIECVIDNGYINQDFLAGNFDVFKGCSLNKELIDQEEDGKYYLAYEVYKFADCGVVGGNLECKNPIDPKNFGVADFKNQCKLREKMIEAKHYADCSEGYLYALNEKGEKLILHVKAGSNQKIKKEVGV